MSGTSLLTHTLKCLPYIGVQGNQRIQSPEKMTNSCDSEMPNEFDTGNTNALSMM